MSEKETEKLFRSITELSDDLIENAQTVPAGGRKKTAAWKKWGAAAACLCLVIFAVPLLARIPQAPQGGAEAAPHFAVDNRTFIVSSHLGDAVTDELPEGFLPAGTISISGGLEDCPYYRNPAVPEWIYVYQEVNTDGTMDAAGNLTRTPPHPAYVRYVDERLRGRDLICYQGEYYISMWSAKDYGDDPDVTEAYLAEMEALYGRRIEGAAPDGFVLAGTAEFTGKDTIPTGGLASNAEAAEVYYDPSDPAVLLMRTHWFTAAAERGETRHDGFDVYIRYDCPFQTGAEAGEQPAPTS